MEPARFAILELLEDGLGHTFLTIHDYLRSKGFTEYSAKTRESMFKLKNLLLEMEEERLIEQRHFDSGKVDYDIDSAAYDYMKQAKN